MASVVLRRGERFPTFHVEGKLPSGVRDELNDELSYFERNSQEKEELLQVTPGGMVYFPAGLLPLVKEILEDNGVTYTVVEPFRNLQNVLNTVWRGHSLRNYQREALNEFLEKGRGVVSLPTGTGKTLLGVRAIHEIGRPAIVLIHQKEVADQWVEAVREYIGVEPARYYDGVHETGAVTVALYQSIYRDGELAKDINLSTYDVLISDETHRVGADTFNAVTMATNSVYRLGLSATPKRGDGADMRIWAGTGPVIYHKSPEWMIARGFLANPVFKIFDTPRAGGPYENWRQEYKNEIIQNEGRNEIVKREAETLASEGKKVYLHVERLPHGEVLNDLIPEAKFAHGKSKDRDEVIEDFRTGDLKILASTLLGEGFDLPELGGVIMCGGMKSEVMTIQKIGRALRPKGGENAVLIDFQDKGDWVSEHSEQRMETYKKYYGRFFRVSMMERLNFTA